MVRRKSGQQTTKAKAKTRRARNGEGTLRQRGEVWLNGVVVPVWEISVAVPGSPGKRKWASVRGTRQTAIERKAAMQTTIESPDSGPKRIYTLREIFIKYFEQCRVDGQSSAKVYENERVSNREWNPLFGEMAVQDLLPVEIQDVVNGMQLRRKLKKKTVKGYLSVLTLALGWGIKIHKLHCTNAAEVVRVAPDRVGDIEEDEPIALEDIVEFLDGLDADDEVKLAIRIMAHTGLRISEALGLWRDDVDLVRGVLHVRRCQRYSSDKKSNEEQDSERVGLYLAPPKTASGRRSVVIDSPLMESVLEALDRPVGQYTNEEVQTLLDEAREYVRSKESANEIVTIKKGPAPYQLCCRADGNLMTVTDLQALFRKAVEAHEKLQLTPHRLRHVYASLLKFVDASDEDRMTILGHASITMTEQYTHPVGGSKEVAAEKVGAILTRNVGSDA